MSPGADRPSVGFAEHGVSAVLDQGEAVFVAEPPYPCHGLRQAEIVRGDHGARAGEIATRQRVEAWRSRCIDRKEEGLRAGSNDRGDHGGAVVGRDQHAFTGADSDLPQRQRDGGAPAAREYHVWLVEDAGQVRPFLARKVHPPEQRQTRKVEHGGIGAVHGTGRRNGQDRGSHGANDLARNVPGGARKRRIVTIVAARSCRLATVRTTMPSARRLLEGGLRRRAAFALAGRLAILAGGLDAPPRAGNLPRRGAL